MVILSAGQQLMSYLWSRAISNTGISVPGSFSVASMMARSIFPCPLLMRLSVFR
jgi:hypothetical protein